MTKIKHLSEAKNGGFALGKIEDVQPLQANKYYDLKTAREEKESLEKQEKLLKQYERQDDKKNTENSYEIPENLLNMFKSMKESMLTKKENN